MNQINYWGNLIRDSFENTISRLGSGLVNLIIAIVILLIGWILTKFIAKSIKKLLLMSKIDGVFKDNNILKFFQKSDWNFKFSDIVATLTRWLIFIFFILLALDVMHWNFISTEVSNIINYLPRLFSGIILFIFGIYLANLIRKGMDSLFTNAGLTGGKLLSSFIYYILVIMITITSLNQAEIKTDIITNNVTIFLGAFLVAMALAFGLGTKDIIKKLLLSYYIKKKYAKDDTIIYKDIKGKIVNFENLSVTIANEQGQIVIPIEDFSNTQVLILKPHE